MFQSSNTPWKIVKQCNAFLIFKYQIELEDSETIRKNYLLFLKKSHCQLCKQENYKSNSSLQLKSFLNCSKRGGGEAMLY